MTLLLESLLARSHCKNTHCQILSIVHIIALVPWSHEWSLILSIHLSWARPDGAQEVGNRASIVGSISQRNRSGLLTQILWATWGLWLTMVVPGNLTLSSFFLIHFTEFFYLLENLPMLLGTGPHQSSDI
jgi:hypothetical protein